jgi:CO/xanthine dehydrogenase Mo-binding subunit
MPYARANSCSLTWHTTGRNVAEVEIDLDTCVVQLVNYTAVDDVGTVINPMIVEGQLHGGIVQGIGQAVIRRCSVTRVSSLSIEIERLVQAVLPLVAQLEHV